MKLIHKINAFLCNFCIFVALICLVPCWILKSNRIFSVNFDLWVIKTIICKYMSKYNILLCIFEIIWTWCGMSVLKIFYSNFALHFTSKLKKKKSWKFEWSIFTFFDACFWKNYMLWVQLNPTIRFLQVCECQWISNKYNNNIKFYIINLYHWDMIQDYFYEMRVFKTDILSKYN